MSGVWGGAAVQATFASELTVFNSAEMPVEFHYAISRKGHYPRFLIPLCPRQVLKSTEECAPQAARQMRPPFTPVEALPANRCARFAQAIYVDAEF